MALERSSYWGGNSCVTGLAGRGDYDSKTVYEAYHASVGAWREEKALQAEFYADELGYE